MTTEAPLWRRVWALAAPAIVAGLVSTVVFFTDRLMLGWFDEAALGSMQVAGPVLWSVFSVGRAAFTGVLSIVGRAVGAGDAVTARSAAWGALLGATAVGMVLGVLGWVWSPELAVLLTAGADAESVEAVRLLGERYMTLVFPAAPLVFFAETGFVALQARGDTRTPMRIGALAGVVNLVVSGLLLFGWGPVPALGFDGAAWGTVTAFVLMAGLCGWALMVGPLAPKRPVNTLWPALLGVLRVGGPTLGEKVVFHAGFLVFATIVGRLGEVAMAANQALLAIESVGFMTSAGFGVAAGTLVAQSLGARRHEEAQRVGWVSAGLGVAGLGAVGLVFLAAPELLLRAFSADPAVLAAGVPCLRVAGVALPIMAATDSLAGALRGAGDTQSPMVVALVGPVCVRLAACWTLVVVLEWGLFGIWVGTTIDWAVRAVALAFVWWRGHWLGRAERRVGTG